MFRRGMFYAYLSVYLRQYLGLNVTETTLFATGPMVMNVVCQAVVWGPLSDRTQKRRTLIILGEIFAALGTVAVWYGHLMTGEPRVAGYVIIVGLTLVEVFWSMSNVGWSALISDLYGMADRQAVQGRLSSVGGLGRMLGVWIGGLLYDGLGREVPGWGFAEGGLFFVAAGVMLLSVGPMLMVPEGGIRSRESSTAASPSHSALVSGDRLFFFFLAALVFINFGRNAVALIAAQYLVLPDGFAVSSQTLGHIINLQSAAMIATGMAAGWIGRRMGNQRSLVQASAGAFVALVMLAGAENIWWIYLSNLLRGYTEVIILAASYAVAAALIPPPKRARYFGYFNATFFLSWGLAGTIIAGPIIDIGLRFHMAEPDAYRVGFWASAGICLLGLMMLMGLSRRLRGIVPDGGGR